MPKKTKEIKEESKTNKIGEIKEKITKKVSKNLPKKESKKGTTTKKSNSKKSNTKNASKRTKNIKSEIKKTTAEVKNKDSIVISKKASTNIKTPTKKSTNNIVEYYDLPYRYNQTVVKVLAQTPTTLFIYWDISDADRENYKKTYGDNFFETTKPVLKVHNITMNYSFEVDINDFANSWYLHVNDAKCDYKIELGRRPIVQNPKINTDYIYVTTSNEIESPNDHILFNKEQKMVYFRNIKNGNETSKPFSANLTFLRNMGKIYNVYDIYKAIYKNENVEEIYNLSNPSSGNPSSDTFSSRFK